MIQYEFAREFNNKMEIGSYEANCTETITMWSPRVQKIALTMSENIAEMRSRLWNRFDNNIVQCNADFNNELCFIEEIITNYEKQKDPRSWQVEDLANISYDIFKEVIIKRKRRW